MESKVNAMVETMETNKLWVIVFVCILAGVAIGFLAAPFTKGISITIGSNNSAENTGVTTMGHERDKSKKKGCCR